MSEKLSCVKERKIIFYTGNNYPRYCIHDYKVANSMIEAGVNRIETTQLVLMTGELFDKGFEVYVNDGKYEYNVKDATDKELRSAHVLYKILIAGGFDPEFPEKKRKWEEEKKKLDK